MKDRPIVRALEHLRRAHDQLRGRHAALLSDRKRLTDRIDDIDADLAAMRDATAGSTDEEFALRRQYFHHTGVAEQHKESLRAGIERLTREQIAPLEDVMREVATKKAALEKLLERRRAEAVRVERAREQALMDEIAGRRAWRPR